jgi:hypothetical protein
VAHSLTERAGKTQEEDDDVLEVFGVEAPDSADMENVPELGQGALSRPWLATIVEPSELPRQDKSASHATLGVYHVFGLQLKLSRASVRYNMLGELVYPTSRFVCLLNKRENRQRLYEEHTSEVCCVAVSPNGSFAASSDRSPRTSIHVWDLSTCQSLCKLPPLHRYGVISMEFSVDHKQIVCTLGCMK